MDAILERFEKLSIWKQGDQRAPHKPLLVLYALGRWQRGDTGDLPFDQLAPDVAALLREFGPPRRSYHPEYPFWWLQSDGVWTVESDGPMAPAAIPGGMDPVSPGSGVVRRPGLGAPPP